MKTRSAFFDDSVLAHIRSLPEQRLAMFVTKYRAEASYWLHTDFPELERMMFPPELKRSWFVHSGGACPACHADVPMYSWLFDAKAAPWKVRCPHCAELFPKNDFQKFYESGLTPENRFDHDLADTTLLNRETDSGFGVDDGTGYPAADGKRYRFIAAYLIYGHWHQLIIEGIETLGILHLLTGDIDCARRVAVLLRSVARRFPDFDYHTQGIMYEKERTTTGYVSYWAGTCHDLRSLSLGYDMVFEAVMNDEAFDGVTGFSAAEWQAVVENNILRDALANPSKSDSNPPDPALTRMIIEAVLDWPANRTAFFEALDVVMEHGTRIDGLTGEKGIASYARLFPVKIAEVFCLFVNLPGIDPESLFRRYPRLRRTYRFFLDAWYAGKYFPGCGDDGCFHSTCTVFPPFFSAGNQKKAYARSLEWFACECARILDEPELYRAIGRSMDGKSVAGAPDAFFENDLYIASPEDMRRQLERNINKHASAIEPGSAAYREWRIVFLRSGKGAAHRLVSMNYDSGANHSHNDALNINLFFYGRNLSPDFGYPPVSYGGWSTPEVEWCRHPESHNIVVIDGKPHENLPPGKFIRYPQFGELTRFHTGNLAQVALADAKEYAGVDRYERLIALVDCGDDAYLLDIFRVSGGRRHVKYFRTLPGQIEIPQATAIADPVLTHRFMRNFTRYEFSGDSSRIDFTCDDGPGLRYYDLTPNVDIHLYESWMDLTHMHSADKENRSLWVPTVRVEREGPESAFVTLYAPFRDRSGITAVRREETPDQHDVIVEVELADGCVDRISVPDQSGKQIIRSGSGGESAYAFFLRRYSPDGGIIGQETVD